MIDQYRARSTNVASVRVFDVDDFVRLHVSHGLKEATADMSPRQARKVARSLWNAAKVAESPPEET